MFVNTYKYRIADPEKWCDKYACFASKLEASCHGNQTKPRGGYTYKGY